MNEETKNDEKNLFEDFDVQEPYVIKETKVSPVDKQQRKEIGLKLAGCDGITVQENDDVEEKIDEIVNNKEIGILVISKKIYEKSKEKINDIRLNKKIPLITII